jgi:hypothetical protein
VKRGVAPALLLLTLAAILGTIIVRMGGPAVLPATASPSVFSAERAIAYERDILGGDVPHPIGSPAHDAVRERLAATFRTLGYDVTIQKSFICNSSVTCAPVANVIARVPGETRQDALVLAAHYDSVPAGPGASDDGVGVAAVVETARALRNEHFRNPIVYLVTDGEEIALLGAEGFVDDPPSLRGAAAVINVEARGTNGPSFLFETSRRNEWIARVIAHALPRPATSSLYYDIYELLPNDTDLTIFKRAGLAGIGFAHIGRPIHYHTPLDNFANVSLPTLQHHGDHTLAMARALAATDLRQRSSGNAVWFDVLSLFILWWPQKLSIFFAIAAMVLLLIAAFLQKGAPVDIAIGVGSFFLTLVAALLVAIGGNWLTGLRAGGAVWVAHPAAAIAVAWLIALAIAVLVAQRLISFAGGDGLFLGHALCWSALAIALSIVLPGGSYLVIVPAVVCAIVALLRATTGMSEGIVAIASAACAAILIFPLGLALYDALGRPILPAVALLIALVATTFTPFLAAIERLRLPLLASALVAAIACIVLALVAPAYEANSPRHLNLEYVDDGVGPRWLTDRILPELQQAAQFNPVPQLMYEWTVPPAMGIVAPAPPFALPPPEVHVVRDERQKGRRLTLQIRSARNAPRIAILFHAPSLAAMRVNGVIPPRAGRRRAALGPGWHRVSVRGGSEMTLELVMTRDEPIDCAVVDSSFGLPAAGAALAHARDSAVAVPVQEGDLTTVLRRIRL